MVKSLDGAKISGSSLAGPEDPGDDEGNELVLRVRAKRMEVERYLRAVGARRRRLVTVTIFAAAISTLLTALAAIFGQELAEFFTHRFGPDATGWWRILCALAAVCSLTAGVATQLQTSKNYEKRIAQAQEIMPSLEALEVAITLGHLNQNEATGQYLKIIEGTSFMHQAG
jgi:MFS family permease